MNEAEIQALKSRVTKGGVYWRNAEDVCEPVLSVKLDWVEFADQPDLTEPAAILAGGGAVALCNVSASSFVALVPALDAADPWPHGATVRLRWTGMGGRPDLDGWAKRDAEGNLVSAYSLTPLDASCWTVVEERKPMQVTQANKPQGASLGM